MCAVAEHTSLSMYFHRCVMDLFRPYIVRGTTGSFQKRHLGSDTPEAIFGASTQRKLVRTLTTKVR
jgi:hypothetical protein